MHALLPVMQPQELPFNPSTESPMGLEQSILLGPSGCEVNSGGSLPAPILPCELTGNYAEVNALLKQLHEERVARLQAAEHAGFS